ncbi:hypothetical protein cypCar_00038221, partial [Cyprinus carpio]
VEILDSKTKEQLCFLDKVSRFYLLQSMTVTAALSRNLMVNCFIFNADPKWYPARQALRLDPTWLAYYINHPLYTPPSYGKTQVRYALIIFV